MFVYPIDSDYFLYEPRTSHPFARNFYQPSQNSRRPCSHYCHNNPNPFYNRPESFYYSTPRNYFDDDYRREQELLNREMAYKEQQEREREQEELLKRFFGRKANEQQQRHHEQKQAQQQKTSDENRQPKRSFKVKIQDGDETKSVNKSWAARKIFNFIKNQSENQQTRKILNKLQKLRTIENELKEIHETKNIGSLTFDEKNGKQVLPISTENKRFLEYEDKIIKIFDKLDVIQSEGADIIRERRKFIVKFAQTLLNELDNEKENQWKEFSEEQLNSDAVMDDTLEKSEESSTTNDDSEVNPSDKEENEVIMEVEQLELTPSESIVSVDQVSDQDEDLMDTLQFETNEEDTMADTIDKEDEISTSPTSLNDLVEDNNEFVFVESKDI